MHSDVTKTLTTVASCKSVLGYVRVDLITMLESVVNLKILELPAPLLALTMNRGKEVCVTPPSGVGSLAVILQFYEPLHCNVLHCAFMHVSI
jgi:hypothetical protein